MQGVPDCPDDSHPGQCRPGSIHLSLFDLVCTDSFFPFEGLLRGPGQVYLTLVIQQAFKRPGPRVRLLLRGGLESFRESHPQMGSAQRKNSPRSLDMLPPMHQLSHTSGRRVSWHPVVFSLKPGAFPHSPRDLPGH